MNKEYNLYELMDSYTDNEFNDVSCDKINSNAICSKTMEKIGVKAKKPVKPKAKIFIIAAAAAALGVIMGASLPGGFLNSKTGDEIIFGGTGSSIGSCGNDIAPYTIEGDRIFLTVDNQHIDITDTINRGENYYYYFNIHDSQAVEHKGIICVGGTIYDLGYGEVIYDIDGNGYVFSQRNISAPYENQKEWVLEFENKIKEYQEKLIEEHQEKEEENKLTA